MIRECLARAGARIHKRIDDADRTLCDLPFGGETNGYDGTPCTDCAAVETKGK